jgi:hypothetical protein
MFDSGSSTGEILGHSKVSSHPWPIHARLDRECDYVLCRSLMPSRSDVNGHSALRLLATII